MHIVFFKFEGTGGRWLEHWDSVHEILLDGDDIALRTGDVWETFRHIRSLYVNHPKFRRKAVDPWAIQTLGV